MIISNRNDVREYTEMFKRSAKSSAYHSKEEWNASNFVDDQDVGWYCLPKRVTCYSSAPDTNELPFEDPESVGTTDYLLATLKTARFWDKFIAFASLEGEAESDNISSDMIKFYKSLFGLYQDQFMHLVQPHLYRMIQSITEKSMHKAAAEILSGLMMGLRYWGWEKLTKMWSWMIPLLTTVINTATPEILGYWESFIKENRDLRRLQPLIQLILKNAALDRSSESFFTDSKKLSLVKVLTSACGWRFKDVSEDLFYVYLSEISHPYQQVRTVLGLNLNTCVQTMWIPSMSSALESVASNLSNRSGGWAKIPDSNMEDMQGDVPIYLKEQLKLGMETLALDMNNWKVIAKAESARGPTQFSQAGKTVMAWLQGAINSHQSAGLYPFIKYFLPMLTLLQDFDDQDLQRHAAVLSQYYPHFPHAPYLARKVVQHLNELLSDGAAGWHSKVQLLPILQVLYFLHLPLMDDATELSVMSCLAGLLNDPQVEVRQAASITLSGLIRCSQRKSINSLLSRFRKSLNDMPRINKRDREHNVTVDEKYLFRLVEKHSIILGLSSIVLAFPYEVPSWMPKVLVELASSIGDPSLISVTIKKMFAEFKRTHQDTWHNDALKFTEDQLYTLNDLLISPSYYV